MKILLLNPPWNVGGKKGVRAGSRWPHLKTDQERDYLPFPFFLAYTSSLLKQNKFDVHLIDAIAEDLTDEEFFERIKKFSPTVILIETSTPSLELDLGYAKKIKKFLDSKIVFVGCDNNITNPQFLLDNSFIDFVIYGEYEFPFLNLVKGLKKGLDLNKVPGLIYRDS
ncbi:MAG: cobalamin-dependent protein, partial [Candidatus Omnitrophota bacterium]|nr:cobalamin-dependent protein [Candidatus Omnitrophota bacterium]